MFSGWSTVGMHVQMFVWYFSALEKSLKIKHLIQTIFICFLSNVCYITAYWVLWIVIPKPIKLFYINISTYSDIKILFSKFQFNSTFVFLWYEKRADISVTMPPTQCWWWWLCPQYGSRVCKVYSILNIKNKRKYASWWSSYQITELIGINILKVFCYDNVHSTSTPNKFLQNIQ